MRAFVSPLATWLPSPAAVAAQGRRLDVRAVVLPPRDEAWRAIAPGFQECLALIGAGLPFQIAADQRYDRSGDARRLAPALAAGKTVFVPQIHQVLPRLARLMVALRVGVLGPRRQELSYLFLVRGRGRPAMGLHHDGEVDSFWLQLEGRRTITLGPRVPRGTPKELRSRPAAGRDRCHTFDLEPGTLFYMPPRTPHDVVCHERSLAVSMTWSRAGYRDPGSAARALVAWDVVSGWTGPAPPVARGRLWTQVPVSGGLRDRRDDEFVTTAGGPVRLAPPARRLAARLGMMPSFRRHAVRATELKPLIATGLVAPRDLPIAIEPDRPSDLDGWRFA
jgi:hypothetical protein